LRADGTLACWGSNSDGQASPPAGTYTVVSAGGLHSCGVRTDGTLSCWGSNSFGQASAPGGTFVSVGTGGTHSCGLRADGTVACWGNSADGRTSAPTGTFTALSVGPFHSCAVRTDQTVACWGLDQGRLGTSPAMPGPTPPAGMVGRPYVHPFTSSPGSPRGSFSISGGDLPPGLTLSEAGVLSGTPTADGEYTFTISVSNGVFPGVGADLTMTVEPNAAPVATSDTYAAQEGSMLDVAAPGVLGNDTDSDGDPLTAIVEVMPAHGEFQLDPGGTFRYLPDGGFNGTDEFTYRASDGFLVSPPVPVTITVASLNAAPLARSDAYTTREGRPLAVAAPGVLANDADDDGDRLTVAVQAGPAHGDLTLNPRGSFRYTPHGGFVGTDRFTYRAMDGHVASPPTSVTIRVSMLPTCNSEKATIVGTRGPDVIIGTRRADVIVSSGGNDTIRGRGGNDLVCAGKGADQVLGRAGNDRLYGGPGPDHLLGGAGNDLLAGQGGNDILDGGPGVDRLLGGPGHNLIDGPPR
jgi:hypothetical protein